MPSDQQNEAEVKALKGQKLPKIIDTGFYCYDESNINDAKIAAVPYDGSARISHCRRILGRAWMYYLRAKPDPVSRCLWLNRVCPNLCG